MRRTVPARRARWLTRSALLTAGLLLGGLSPAITGARAAGAFEDMDPVTAPVGALTPAAAPDPMVSFGSYAPPGLPNSPTTTQGIACPSPSFCVAVGQYSDASGDSQGLIETYTGTWSGQTANYPVAPSGLVEANLQAVACTSTTVCVAVGYYNPTNGDRLPLIDVLTGTTWSAVPVTLPIGPPAAFPNPEVEVPSISCPAAGSCVAVGAYDTVTSSGNALVTGLILSQGATGWTTSEAPLAGLSPGANTSSVAGLLDALQSVSCTAVGSCVAVGGYKDTNPYYQGLIETLSGSTWTAQTAPTSPLVTATDPYVDLGGVSCVPSASPISCVATGIYSPTNPASASAPTPIAGLLETLSGTAWTAAAAPMTNLTPTPATTPDVLFGGVSCPAVGSCVAVGSYEDNSTGTDALIETETNGTWASSTGLETGLSPAAETGGETTAGLLGVDCVAVEECQAVGDYTDTNGSSEGLIETLTGGTWQATTALLSGPLVTPPASTTDPDAQLTTVACPSTQLCFSAGSYDTPPTDSDPSDPQGLLLQLTPPAPAAGPVGAPPTTTPTTTPSTAASSLSTIRLGGPDRYGTAVAISQNLYPTAGSASAVVLARGDILADALSGVPLAVAKNAPLLLTHPPSLDAGTLAEIERVLPKGDTVYMLGDSDALAPGIATTLTEAGYVIVRYGGADRFATAVVIANQGLANPTTIFLASGLDGGDALSASAPAGADHGAILLTNGSAQHPDTATYLTAHPSDDVVAVGGPAASADPGATTKIVGSDRYDTSQLVATTYFTHPTSVGIADGDTEVDALAGGVLMAEKDGPLLLVQVGALPPTVTSYLTSIGADLSTLYVFGGTLAIDAAVESAAQAAIAAG